MAMERHPDIWHNPDHVTHDQLDPERQGWRLLTKEEVVTTIVWSQITCSSIYSVQAWCSSGKWSRLGYLGNSMVLTYRTSLPLTDKYRPKKDDQDCPTPKWLQSCRLAVYPHPMFGNDPYDNPGATITFAYGKSRDGRIGDDGRFEAYNGETLPLGKPLVILP